MVFPPRCVGLGPMAQGGGGIHPSLSGQVGGSPGSTLKAGAQGRCRCWERMTRKSLCCGWEDLQLRGPPHGGAWVSFDSRFLAEDPRRFSRQRALPSQHPQPGQRMFLR